MSAYGQLQACLELRHPTVIFDLRDASLADGLAHLVPLIRTMEASSTTYNDRCAKCILQSGRVHIAYLIECLTSKRYAVHTVHGYRKFLAQTGLNLQSITQHFTETAAKAGYSVEKWRWFSLPLQP